VPIGLAFALQVRRLAVDARRVLTVATATSFLFVGNFEIQSAVRASRLWRVVFAVGHELFQVPVKSHVLSIRDPVEHAVDAFGVRPVVACPFFLCIECLESLRDLFCGLDLGVCKFLTKCLLVIRKFFWLPLIGY
jgi:hypothetical protein